MSRDDRPSIASSPPVLLSSLEDKDKKKGTSGPILVPTPRDPPTPWPAVSTTIARGTGCSGERSGGKWLTVAIATTLQGANSYWVVQQGTLVLVPLLPLPQPFRASQGKPSLSRPGSGVAPWDTGQPQPPVLEVGKGRWKAPRIWPSDTCSLPGRSTGCQLHVPPPVTAPPSRVSCPRHQVIFSSLSSTCSSWRMLAPPVPRRWLL